MIGRRAKPMISLQARGVEFDPAHKAYRARGAALRLWGCKAEEVLIEGPAGTGKTRAILEKVHLCCMKYPGIRVLLVRKTRESLTQTVLVTFEEKVVQEDHPILIGPQRNLRQCYRYPNGSEIVLGGMDKPIKVMSSEYDLVATFESTELTEEDFENLTTRLRNGMMPYQQIVADCNPGPPQHWLNRRATTGKMIRLLSRHRDNPQYYDEVGNPTDQGEKYLSKLRRLSGHRYQRLFLGKWAAAEGMVYDFDPAIHGCKPFKLTEEYRRIRIIDFGYVNPFVCQWWAISPDRTMYLYREIYRQRRLVSEHAKDIRRLSGVEKYEATIADWDAEDRATLEAADIFTIPAFKDVTPGIEAVNARLKPDERGKPGLFLFHDARVEIDEELREIGLPTCTEEEFDGYTYPKKPANDKAPKEEPVKKDDHGMDACRYAVAYVDNIHGMRLKVEADSAVVVAQ